MNGGGFYELQDCLDDCFGFSGPWRAGDEEGKVAVIVRNDRVD
jgi:hypothetical protein